MTRITAALLLMLAIIAAWSEADAALAVDSHSTVQISDSASALSWTHTILSGTNNVTTFCTGGAGLQTTSVTVDGSSAGVTKEPKSEVVGATPGVVYVSRWYVKGLSAGAHAMVANFSGTGRVGAGSVAYTGADQTTPVSHGVSASGSTAPPTANSVASESGNIADDCMFAIQAAGTPPTVNQTLQYSGFNNSNGDVIGQATAAGAGTSALTAFAWTTSGSANRNFGEAGFSVNAVSNAPTSPKTWNAASCARADIVLSLAFAQDGDTVSLPACGATSITSTINVPNTALTFQGAGVGVTILKDDVPKWDGAICNGGPLFAFTGSGKLRIGNFTLQGSATDPQICATGHMTVDTLSHDLRIHHITITNQTTLGFMLRRDPQGVIDHITCDASNVTHRVCIYVRHTEWNGVGLHGDNSWAQPDTFGTAAAMYSEDITCIDPSAQGTGCVDTDFGARDVVRFSTLSFLGDHGTETNHRDRSIRQREIYANVFTSQANGTDTANNHRGGTIKQFLNTYQCKDGDCVTNFFNSIVVLNNDRDRDPYPPWGPGGAASMCDGTSLFDVNINGVYATGSHTGANGAAVLTDGTKSFTTNQYVAYAIRNLTRSWANTINSNTATTITSPDSIFGGQIWNNGDSYEIRKAYPCLDQIGRGQGDLLSGGTPTPQAWPNQALSPEYYWLNNFKGSYNTAASSVSRHVIADRDYYDYKVSFTGASGVGSGTRAARPATCTTGVAYWSTDQGSWNAGTNAIYTGQGVLDKCTSTNTWTDAFYTPYAYPHPLITGAQSTTITVTSNLNPSLSGQSVTFTAALLPGSGPTGTLTFYDGVTVLGTSTLPTKTLTTSSLALGAHSITVSYGGDASYTGSTSPAITQTVQATTSITVASSLNPSVQGQLVTFTATLTPSSGPTGTLTFKDGATILGTATLPTTTLATSALSPGAHSITVVYGGDATYLTSTSPALTQTVKTATTTVITSSPNPSTSGQTVTFTAIVNGGAGVPTGTVTFLDGVTVIGTATIPSNPTFPTSSLGVGSHSMTASYAGDANFGSSVSSPITQTVNSAPVSNPGTTLGGGVKIQGGVTIR